MQRIILSLALLLTLGACAASGQPKHTWQNMKYSGGHAYQTRLMPLTSPGIY